MPRALNLVKPQDWALFLDLKDAYLHVPINKSHRKYLSFYIQGKMYQFVTLWFSQSHPRVFTKIVTIIAAHLRIHNVRLAKYIRLVTNKYAAIQSCITCIRPIKTQQSWGSLSI